MFVNVHYNYRKNTITLWEYNKEGVREQITEDYQPYCFVYDKAGTYKDLNGKACKRKEFPDWKSQREFVKDYDTLEGDISPDCRFVVDRYYDKDLLSYLPKLNMHIIDIETYSDGYPIATNPECKIYLITVYSTKIKKFITFGTSEYTGKFPIDYVYCDSEEELLRQYFKFHKKDYPDIISGWYSSGFDVPYIIERANFLLGESFVNKYSPVNDVQIKNYNGEKTIVIGGITQLDYMVLYKDYNLIEQESYRLDYIASQELGEKKLKYKGTLTELRENDWNKFVEYNIKDVYLVKKLHDKLDFITLVQGQAYLNKVPLDRVSSAMRKMDGYLLSILKPLKVVLPTTKKHESGVIPGGYVKEIKEGYYKHVVTYDYTSLYPSIMFALNLSHETFVGKIELTTGRKQMVEADNNEWYPFLDLENIIDSDLYKLNGEEMLGETLKSLIKKNKWLISANGLLFTSDWGFIPRVVKGLFDKRKEFKNAMLSEEKLYEETKEKKHQDNAKRYDALQSAQKVMCNSAYGVIANKNFRLFNEDFASAITLTGQKINQYTTRNFEEFFLKNFNATNVVIASDTDSFILDIDCFINKYNIKEEDYLKAFTLFDEKMIRPNTVKWTEYFSNKLVNNEKNWFHLKKEVVSNGVIMVEKKKYAMQMIEKEGIKYEKPKMKIMGMEIVRSSTPSFCRKKIKDMVVMIINEFNKEKLRTSLKEIRKEFDVSPIDVISRNSSVKNIEEYSKDGTYIDGCPMHVRASINHNSLVKKLNLEKKYNVIKDGDKIKFIYIKPSLKYKENIIAYIGEFPEEFNLTNDIDYDIQWEKSFMSPIQKISQAIGWGLIDLNQDSLESFF